MSVEEEIVGGILILADKALQDGVNLISLPPGRFLSSLVKSPSERRIWYMFDVATQEPIYRLSMSGYKDLMVIVLRRKRNKWIEVHREDDADPLEAATKWCIEDAASQNMLTIVAAKTSTTRETS